MKMPPRPVPGRTNGHAVIFVGYDDTTKLMKFKNSWGTGMGDRGYYYMPYDYLRWTHDAWVLWGQNIQLPVSVSRGSASESGVSASAACAAGTTNAEKFTISAGKQPCETWECVAPTSG
ncbi:hypothetical protein DL98DRAFT_661967 [Cadophora sp. DSE1049]|nr:hypothetical protein DL98DRAFT_661967 [Cadophora sp. DSE1049]